MTVRVIDASNGLLAGEWGPDKKREYFKPGTEPTEVCNVHTEPMQDSVTLDVPRSIRVPDPVRKGIQGIGAAIRKIFRF